MNDWIEEKAAIYRQRVEENDFRAQNINLSNWWDPLVEQLVLDIETINAEDWKGAIGDGLKTRLEDHFFSVETTKMPFIAVYVSFAGETSVKVGISSKRYGSWNRDTENSYDLAEDGRDVLLIDGANEYSIPYTASEFLLTPILDELINSVTPKRETERPTEYFAG